MSQLGPVTGNRLADAHKATLKPHLRRPLAQQSCRNTPLGTVTTDAQGLQAFVPNYLASARGRIKADQLPMPHLALHPGRRVRVSATVAQLRQQHVFAFAAPVAHAVAGREGVVVECLQSLALTLVVVALDGEHWTFVPEYLAPVPPAEGDDEREAIARGPAFDPYSEPLALGDTVQDMDGRIGRVTLIEPRRLGVVYGRGSAWCGHMNHRGSLRLLAKAAPPATAWGSTNGCPF